MLRTPIRNGRKPQSPRLKSGKPSRKHSEMVGCLGVVDTVSMAAYRASQGARRHRSLSSDSLFATHTDDLIFHLLTGGKPNLSVNNLFFI